MKKPVLLPMLAAASLTGCGQPEAADNAHRGDRYLGIGVYSAGGLWQHLIRKDAPKDRQAATLSDDDRIIVTVDSHTGEIRQCGNFSGYCVSSNPWKGHAPPAPASLSKHAADLAKEHEAAASSKQMRRHQAG